MIEHIIEANKDAKFPSASLIEYAKNLSIDTGLDIYVYWNDRDFIYSISEYANKYAPIILGGWTPKIIAHFKKGELQ